MKGAAGKLICLMGLKRPVGSPGARWADRDQIDAAWSPQKASFCLAVCAALGLLIGAAQFAAALMPAAHFRTAAAASQFVAQTYIDHLFVWDARWYDSIARHGYALVQDANGQSNAAFFPLWPLILRSIYGLFGAAVAGRSVVAIVAAAIACASIFALHRLASGMMRPAGARFATLLYAFNPAAHFMFQSYPTGLLNLLAILALECVVQRRFWRAAVFAGLASAAGPLGALLAPTVVLAAAFEPPREGARWTNWRAVLRHGAGLAGMAVVGVSGVLLFMAWLYYWLDAPLAFAAAQQGWMKPLPFFNRLAKFIYFEVFPLNFRDAWRDGLKAVRHWQATGWQSAEFRFEALLGSVGMGLGLAGTLCAGFLRPRWPAFFAWSVISAYIWLIATNSDSQAALRHIYVAVPSFMGLARLVYWSPTIAYGMLGLSGIALVVEVMLSYRGYWVV